MNDLKQEFIDKQIELNNELESKVMLELLI